MQERGSATIQGADLPAKIGLGPRVGCSGGWRAATQRVGVETPRFLSGTWREARVRSRTTARSQALCAASALSHPWAVSTPLLPRPASYSPCEPQAPPPLVWLVWRRASCSTKKPLVSAVLASAFGEEGHPRCGVQFRGEGVVRMWEQLSA
jgi:hypothetical protein